MTKLNRTWHKGEYCIYIPHKDAEEFDIGRVISDEGDSCFVCYHSGCTAAKTSKRDMIPVRNSVMVPNLGLHRFDDECEAYREDLCSSYCPEKSGAQR